MCSSFGCLFGTYWCTKGINSRFYSGYKPEDFIGRVANLCQAANNCNVEYFALHRFYLGCFEPDLQNCRVVFFSLYALSSSKNGFIFLKSIFSAWRDKH